MNIVLILLLAAVAKPAPASISSIDSLCERVLTYAVGKEASPRIFADVSDQANATSKEEWRAFKSKDALDRLAKEQDIYTQAFVWQHGGATLVSILFTSPSGDWAHYVDYCFRADGSLARITSTLNTFNVNAKNDDDSPVSRIRTKHFNPAGELLRSRTRVLSIKSKKPVKVAFMDQDEPFYRRIRDLPFGALLP